MEELLAKRPPLLLVVALSCSPALLACGPATTTTPGADDRDYELVDELPDGPVPPSRYVRQSSTIVRGSARGIECWAQIASRKDGVLPTTTGEPREFFIELAVLIRNTGDTPLSFVPRELELEIGSGERLSAFAGEPWDRDFVWLAPQPIELNHRDVSLEQLRSIVLEPGDYAVGQVSFPMQCCETQLEAFEQLRVLVLPQPGGKVGFPIRQYPLD